MAHKLLFNYKREYHDDISLIANNYKDLESYLRSKFDWYKISIFDNCASIQERESLPVEFATLEWVEHI